VDHAKARELFSDYLEGELDDGRTSELESHLEECEECRRDLKLFSDTMRAVSGLEEVEAPEDFATKVHHRLRRRLRHRRKATSPWSHKIPFETICLIMLVILVAFYIMLYLLPSIESGGDFQPAEEVEHPGSREGRPRPSGRRLRQAVDAAPGATLR
jgi:anti-sigma factor RsiW